MSDFRSKTRDVSIETCGLIRFFTSKKLSEQHALYACLIGFAHYACIAVTQLGFSAFAAQPVRCVGMKALYLAGAGNFEALFRT